jgi:hypothetical protein
MSDARLRRLKTKLLYPDHRSPPWLTEDATPRSIELLLDVSHRIEYECILKLLQRRADLRLIKIQRKFEFVTDTGLILRNTM